MNRYEIDEPSEMAFIDAYVAQEENIVYRITMPHMYKRELAARKILRQQQEHDRLFQEGQLAIKTLEQLTKYLEDAINTGDHNEDR